MGERKSSLCAVFCVSAVLVSVMGVTRAVAATLPAPGAVAPPDLARAVVRADDAVTATPIKHLVILYDENVSFDHYFATYPIASNPNDEPLFTAGPRTSPVNNLLTANLLGQNPNTNNTNGANAAAPFRLDRAQAATADQNHAYTAKQQAYDAGRADLFPTYTGNGTAGGAGAFGTQGQVMGYFDGNTVTALWNYAQHFALSDNAYTDTYGASTAGALAVVAGQTNGLQLIVSSKSSYYVSNTDGSHTLVNDVDPAYDVCSNTADQAMLNAKNIGDLLNAANLTWGGFMGGFTLNRTNPNGSTGCARSTVSPVVGATIPDYVPHHDWFQYFASTANPTHARPASLIDIGYSYSHDGHADPANHQYGLEDFYDALSAGNFPSVSYVKLPAYQDGHAGYSDPLDEQAGIVKLINFLERLPDWRSTAVIITYDDSDGWYDHAFTAPASSSFDQAADQLDGVGRCGTGTPPSGVSGKPVNGRCGPGTRVPFLVISPWAKRNYVAQSRISQASVVRFIEDNWLNGERLGDGSFDASAGSITSMFNFVGNGTTPKLFLDESTGAVE